MKNERGMIAVFQALMLGPASVALVAAMQDWYVDVSAPGCATATGTQLDPFCNIMDAVHAASDGDTIHIGSGIYFENILLDKDLTLIGTRGQQSTILDGMASGSVVRVRDSAATLTGLTLTNGTGTSYPTNVPGYGTYMVLHGGGLFVYSPTVLAPPVNVSYCSVVGNSATFGGGVANGVGSPSIGGNSGTLTLTSTTVSGNSAVFHPYAYPEGGGISSSGALFLVDSEVSGNMYAGEGGGIAAVDVTLTNSTVSGNSAGFLGGGIRSADGSIILTGSTVEENQAQFGGGILSSNGSVTLTDSEVEANIVSGPLSGGGGYGGGITSFLSTVTLYNSTVSGNMAIRTGIGSFGGPGGGILVSGGALALTDSWLSHNVADFGGGGIYANDQAFVTLTNSVVIGNMADLGGGIMVSDSGSYPGGTVTLRNCTLSRNGTNVGYGGAIEVSGYFYTSSAVVENSILWNNGPQPLSQYGPHAGATVDYSLIEGDWPGVSNLNQDPRFVDPNGNYRLSPGSPCIDAGNNNPVPPEITTDLLGFPRFIDDPLTLDTGVGGPPTVDMGAFEFLPRARRLFNARTVPVPYAPPRTIR